MFIQPVTLHLNLSSLCFTTLTGTHTSVTGIHIVNVMLYFVFIHVFSREMETASVLCIGQLRSLPVTLLQMSQFPLGKWEQ